MNSATTSVRVRQDLKNMEYFSIQMANLDSSFNDNNSTNLYETPHLIPNV